MSKSVVKKANKKTDEIRVTSVFRVKDINSRGIRAVFGAVRLNWPFLSRLKVDEKNPLKAQYRVQCLIESGEKEFVADMKKACEQYLKAAKVPWGGDVRARVLKQMFDLDADKGFFKIVEIPTGQALAINTHSTVMRQTEHEEFSAKYPPKIFSKTGEPLENPDDIEREIYAGCYADVAVWIQAYDVDAAKGLSVYLNGVRKLADGPSLFESLNPFAGIEPTAVPKQLIDSMSMDNVPF